LSLPCQVERGVTTNFTIAAGPAYPVYITDDPIGGAGLLNTSAGHIYAGGPQAHGTVAVPYRLSWTPNHTTPDMVYYQVRFKLTFPSVFDSHVLAKRKLWGAHGGCEMMSDS
jgi:hypothetical protein